MLPLGLWGRESFDVARTYGYGWVNGGRKAPIPLGWGPSSVPPAYSRLDCRAGVTGGSTAIDVALVVFFLGGILPLLALLCLSSHE